MSNSKTAIGEIKKLMVQFGFLTDESTPLSFKLEDNTILQTAKLAVGNKIVKINEAFEQVALEDGSYRLVENFSIEVVNGEIKAVREIFVDAKLIDGTEIKVEGDAVVEGAKIVVKTADSEIPAPDGVHELEDGTKVETKDGVIVVVTEAMADVIPPAEAPEMEEPEVEVEVGMSKEMIDMLKEFITKMGEKMGKMEQSYSTLQNEFNSFKKEPAAKKIADGKTQKFNNVSDSDDVLDTKVASIMALRNK
jgi:hypothetical protein